MPSMKYWKVTRRVTVKMLGETTVLQQQEMIITGAEATEAANAARDMMPAVDIGYHVEEATELELKRFFKER